MSNKIIDMALINFPMLFKNNNILVKCTLFDDFVVFDIIEDEKNEVIFSLRLIPTENEISDLEFIGCEDRILLFIDEKRVKELSFEDFAKNINTGSNISDEDLVLLFGFLNAFASNQEDEVGNTNTVLYYPSADYFKENVHVFIYNVFNRMINSIF